MNTINLRIEAIKNGELSLAIEGKYTNLRIWTGKDANGKHPFTEHDTVFMRLDKYQEYSTHLSIDSVIYLNKESETVNSLLKYGFKSSIENLPHILEITKDLKQRNCLSW